MNARDLLVAVVVAAVGLPAAAMAQQRPKVWDIPLGTPVAALPDQEFVDPACGTNGGPPSRPLAHFSSFEECPPEGSGLREVWFRHDDELEYIGRAFRDPALIDRYRENQLLGQPLILSLLIDRDGLVQGYRIFTDPRADDRTRRRAHDLALTFRSRYGAEGWTCRDLPLAEGERPIGNTLIKQECIKRSDEYAIRVEARHLFKPGQDYVDPHTNQIRKGYFESVASIEVVAPSRLQ